MATIPEVCEIISNSTAVYLQTHLSGDTVTITGVNLDENNAAALAWLINQTDELKIEITKNT